MSGLLASLAPGLIFEGFKGLLGMGSAAADSKLQYEHRVKLQNLAYQQQRQLINEQNEYNAPVNAMSRLSAAGLNPYSYTGTNSGNQPSAGSPPPFPSDSSSYGLSHLSKLFDALQVKQLTENIKGQEKDNEGKDLENKGKKLDNKLKEDTLEDNKNRVYYEAEIKRFEKEFLGATYEGRVYASNEENHLKAQQAYNQLVTEIYFSPQREDVYREHPDIDNYTVTIRDDEGNDMSSGTFTPEYKELRDSALTKVRRLNKLNDLTDAQRAFVFSSIGLNQVNTSLGLKKLDFMTEAFGWLVNSEKWKALNAQQQNEVLVRMAEEAKARIDKINNDVELDNEANARSWFNTFMNSISFVGSLFK